MTGIYNGYECIRLREWRAVFTDRSPRNWWFKLMPKSEYTHCDLIGNDGFGWVLVTPKNASIAIYTLVNDINTTPEEWAKEFDDVEVVKTRKFASKAPRVILFSTWTCVEVCKSILGIGEWYLVTPDQLHYYLKMDGKVSKWWKAKNMAFSALAHLLAVPLSLIIAIVRK